MFTYTNRIYLFFNISSYFCRRLDDAFEAIQKSHPKQLEADLEYFIRKLPSNQPQLKRQAMEMLEQTRNQSHSIFSRRH